MIYPVIWWFEVMQYCDERAAMIANMVLKTWLVRYPWPVETPYDQGGELLGHRSKNS